MKIKKIILLALSVAILPQVVLAGWDIGSLSKFGLPSGTIPNIITGIMNWLLGILGLIGIIGFAIAGILYLTSAGDETRMGTAKKAMVYSIIGVIVGLSGLVVIKAIDSMLRANPQ